MKKRGKEINKVEEWKWTQSKLEIQREGIKKRVRLKEREVEERDYMHRGDI